MLATLALTLTFCTPGLMSCELETSRRYDVHPGITSTVFWVGEVASGEHGPIVNTASAWDDDWLQHYGGIDDPTARNGYQPAAFLPQENPFYCALPYNDLQHGRRKPNAATVVPWAGEGEWGARESMCKNRWVKIVKGKRTVYAQWEDAGPFGTDDAAYVFGSEPPANEHNKRAGIDVSPAVRDALGLGDIDRVDWQFIDAGDVPPGPWRERVTTSQITWR